MGALIKKTPCPGVAILLAILVGMVSGGMANPGAGPWTTGEVLEEGLTRGPAPETRSRGDLLLAGNEEQIITGNLTYRRAILGTGSRLFLKNCTLNLTGDGSQIPSLEGNPSVLSLKNSTVKLEGMNGSSKLRSMGTNTSVDINVSDTFEMLNSSIFLEGGSGWSKTEPGAPYSSPLSGLEFSGGNCTFILEGGKNTTITIDRSRIDIFGGDGGKAPDGEDLDSDEFHLSGGYTTGADVSGWVGSGGGIVMKIDAPGASMSLSDLDIRIEGGFGGGAGDAGGVIWDGEKTYSHPTTSGGYSSGGWNAGSPYDPGTVSGDVGSGGFCILEMGVDNLFMTRTNISLFGGKGGLSGAGGSCISEKLGDPPTATNTLGGGGGGGYAGGYGGYISLLEYDGGSGGDILDRVASGGDADLDINCTGSIWMENNCIEILSGSVFNNKLGGDGGGEASLGFDGGGGGGAGYSAGGGAPARLLYNNLDEGSNGTMDPQIAMGGDYSVGIYAEMIMSRGKTRRDLNGGTSISFGPVDGASGEVGGMPEYDGGDGGKGSEKGLRRGSGTYSTILPAPFPVYPENLEIITDLSLPFEWSSLDGEFYPDSEYDFTFSLLNCENLSDINQQFVVTGLSTYLMEEIEDGRYFWTVKPHKGNATTSWMEPQCFILDREAPVVVSGPGFPWLPSDDPTTEVIYRENLTGLDPETVKVRHCPAGGSYCDWMIATITDEGEGRYSIEVNLPSAEGNYSFQVKASDRAGNGPILAGPYLMGIDGTPPVIENVEPEGWSGSSFILQFDSRDILSGHSKQFNCSIDGENDFDPEVREYENHRFTTTSPVDLEQGNYTLEITTRDLVGNEGSSGRIDLFIDGTSPLLVAYTPANGSVINDPVPAPSIKVLDDLSGPLVMDYHLEGPSKKFDLRYGQLEETVDVTLDQPLPEGNYTWYANVTDLVGNRLNAGPFHFTVDLTPPVLEVINFNESSLEVKCDDRLSGLNGIEILCEIPDSNGWSEVWKRSMELIPDHPSNHYTVGIDKEFPAPLFFLSVRGTDEAGNVGQWSERKRYDSSASEIEPVVLIPGLIGADSDIMVEMDLPLGIDISSVVVKMKPDSGSVVVLNPKEIEVTGNSIPFEGSDLVVPSRVKGTFNSPFDNGTFEMYVVFKDAIPHPREWKSGPSALTVDGEAPEINLGSKPYYTDVPARVLLDATDSVSGISEIRVSVGGGEYGPVNVPGAPFVTVDGDGIMWLNINLSYGPRTEIGVRVKDDAGNVAKRSITTRATRAPLAMIGSNTTGSLKAGREYRFTADCQDPDGDSLRWTWYVDGILAGTGEVLETTFENGTHRIVLNCTDGDLYVEHEITVTVEAEMAEEIPEEREQDSFSFPWLIAILVLILVLAVVSVIIILLTKGSGEEVDDWEIEDDEEAGSDENVQMSRGSSREGAGALQCDICLKRIRSSKKKVKCRCGASFHRSCASGEGECPECGREIMLVNDA